MMKKINIIGTTGVGKSTFGGALAEELGYPFVELDRLRWQDNWQELSDEDFLDKVESSLSQPTWVLDGNYSMAAKIKWRDVDTVIWLNYSFMIVLFRGVKRVFKRIITKEKLWGTNNDETFSKLFSRDSIIWWAITTHRIRCETYRKIIENPIYTHINFIEIKSPREAKNFLNNQI